MKKLDIEVVSKAWVSMLFLTFKKKPVTFAAFKKKYKLNKVQFELLRKAAKETIAGKHVTFSKATL